MPLRRSRLGASAQTTPSTGRIRPLHRNHNQEEHAMTSNIPRPLTPPAQARDDLDILIGELWPREADDFRDNPYPDHPLLVMVRLLLWQASLDQPQLPPAPAPRLCADLPAVMAIATTAAVQMPSTSCWPATLLEVLARLLHTLNSPDANRTTGQLLWLATGDGAILPVHLRHELIRPADGLRARHVAVRVQSPTGATLATVEYRTDNDLLRPASADGPRDITTVDDLITTLLADLNETLSSVWHALHGRTR
ncbi:hypothetical protein A9X06_04920 [Mycobacterium sp. 852002-51759_SCH5129042]|nr:hypothetical protein A9X06_04920 [Mycobacterium sp. 852002-51759_SCH5129042]